MPTDQTIKKCVFVLSFGIFISVILHASAAASSNDHLQGAPANGDYVKVEKVLRPWDSYTDFITDQSLEENSNEKRASAFYPLRGKKTNLEKAVKAKLDELSSLYMKDEEQKKAVAFVPVRGRKASYFIPTRGRKASAFTPMRGKKEQESDGEDSSSYWKNIADAESGATQSPRQPDESGDLRDMELTLPDDLDKVVDNSLLDGADKRGQSFFGSRGKKRVFPFVTTWRVFQRLRSAPETQGSKREALFFASRGKRSPDTVKP